MTTEQHEAVVAVQAIAAVPTILEVACRTTGMGFAAVARVTDDRWIACGVRDGIGFGLEPGGELKLETTLCHDVRRSGDAIVIEDATEDTTYCGHPTPQMYGFRSYISVPIVLADGSFFGTLCAIDPQPAKVKSPEVVRMFKLFADLIAHHMDAASRLATSEEQLFGERETSRLREEFIAVLGHDLRNPLAAIASGIKILGRTGLEGRPAEVVRLMQGSVVRMEGLIDNVLDFARGRLGGGLTLRSEPTQVAPILRQVIEEMRSAWPGRRFEIDLRLDRPIECDGGKIAQLFSNLVGNAITHGAADGPIRITATAADGHFELSVANSGDPIPEAAREQLFQPFARGRLGSSLQGLGLGLYISSEIAQAHGGELSAESTDEQTRFTLRMPVARG